MGKEGTNGFKITKLKSKRGGIRNMRSSNPFGTCAYCGRRIMWICTKAGKNMPVDPEMISYHRPAAGERASEKIVTQNGEVVSADRVDSSQAEGVGYISHFATCPRRRR